MKSRTAKGLQAKGPAEDGKVAFIDQVREGVPAVWVKELSEKFRMPRYQVYGFLNLPRATVDRSIATNKKLTQDQGERVLATSSLIGLVEKIVKESGNPKGFDSAAWLGSWLDQPHPALAGKTPGSYLDTSEGIGMVRDLLIRAQTGAYA